MELLLNEEIVKKAMKKLAKTPEYGCLRELIDDLLKRWVGEKQ